ncbi:MAG: hypothetical protein PHF81_04970 [Flavobacterium sp.]|jgi:hypothetical protein|nr:hypothetical protein [Flavobacterium sp.]
MSVPKLKINLFGESQTLKRVVFNSIQKMEYAIIAQRMKQPLHQALIDPYFYFLLKNDNIQSFEDFGGFSNKVLLNTPKNQIEIWYQNKKIQKLKINDLLEELLLFPLYSTKVLEKSFNLENGIYIEQKEIGWIGQYEIMIDNFRIEELLFQLSSNNLQKITYQDKEFRFIKSDALLTYQNSFELKI